MTFGQLTDGIVTTDVTGRVVRVFKPHWWEVWRWLHWWWRRDGDWATVAWIVPIAHTRFWRSDGKILTRCYVLPATYTLVKSPPNAKAKRLQRH